MASGSSSIMPSGDDPFVSPAAGDVKTHLQSLLDEKEKQLQQAATLGQAVLAQQAELEERIRQLEGLDVDRLGDEHAHPEAKEKIAELMQTLEKWESENAKLSTTFNLPGSGSNDFSLPLEATSGAPREESSRSKGPQSSAAQSRRAKNAAHRAEDVEFAFEIGSGLLHEVRRLQSLLGERDKAIQDMKEEKDDLEASVEALRTALKQQEQSADKYKEENWNLEVTLQEMRTQLTDTQSDVQRLEGEQKRLNRLLNSSRDATEQFKNEKENLQVQIEGMTSKHETDVALARKHAASLARDKSDLQQTVDTLKQEVARSARKFPKFGSPLTPNTSDGNDFLTPGDRDDVFSNGGASTNRRRMDSSAAAFHDEVSDMDTPEGSPVKQFLAPNHPKNEIEALQQKLAHAQRQISTLKGTLAKEKMMKVEYRRQLESSPGGGASFRLDEDEDEDGVFEDEDTTIEPAKKRKPFAGRATRGGRGRGRGRGRGGRPGMSLTERLLAANQSMHNADEEDDEGEWTAIDEELTQQQHNLPESPIPIRLQEPESLADTSPASNRSSVDGMDPAFANVLKRTPSQSSMAPNSSPLRSEVLRRSARGGATIGRRGRGGKMWQDQRPSSIADQPEDLAAALNMSGSPLKGEDAAEGLDDSLRVDVEEEVAEEEAPAPREFSEFACQTEPLELPPPPRVLTPPPPPPVVETAEAAVQIEPPTVPSAETSMQTDTEVATPKADMAIQHSTETPKPKAQPILVDSGMITEPPPALAARIPPVRDRRTTLTQQQVREASALSESSGDQTVEPTNRQFLAPGMAEEDEGEETETGAETETDTDDYQDARASISLSTPAMSTTDHLQSAGASTDDFHSIVTMTDVDYGSSEEDDVESIMTRRSATSSARVRPRPSFAQPPPPPQKEYDTKEVSADLIQLPKQPEVKEISIQTDSLPVPFPEAEPMPSPTFSKVGAAPGGQQFQFIPPRSGSRPSRPSIPTALAPAAQIAAASQSSVFRDSNGLHHARNSSDASRRQSIDSIVSALEENKPRSRAPSGNTLAVVDKTKPPMMMVPPPPRAPPPPGSMPPPSFIPERPPRPSSPPPPELIQRATTPTFGAALNVPGNKGSWAVRQSGSSMPPTSSVIRQPSSTSSFRSAMNPGNYQPNAQGLSGITGPERRAMSSASFLSASPRSSVSSDLHPPMPTTPHRSGGGAAGDTTMDSMNPTDPAVIHSITQTMIGEFLYKYTRKSIGKGHGQTRHKRFFWVHPYTRTLYWSSADPGSSNVTESSAKSAYVEGVRSVLDPNPMPPGLYQYSVVVSTPQREMKITAPTKERHDIWLNAMKYLLSRPGTVAGAPGPGPVPQSPMSGEEFTDEDHTPMAINASPQSQRSRRNTRTTYRGDTWNSTPRGKRSRSQLSVGGSIGKRSGTPAAEYLRWNAPDSPYSPTRSFVDVPGGGDEEDLDFELHGDSHSDDGFEGLENVRACCDGRHTVGRSGKIIHHHDCNEHENENLQPTRPISPSGWSFRSKGSTTSREGAAAIFSKSLRFGSRRSTKTVPIQPS